MTRTIRALRGAAAALLTGALLLGHSPAAPAHIIVTYAGNGTGEGLPATRALIEPNTIAADAQGNVYVFTGSFDSLTFGIRKIAAGTGLVSTIVGVSGTMATDNLGRFVYASNNQIFRLENGSSTLIAGTGSPTHSGDGGPAIAAGIELPRSIAVDAAGNVFVAEEYRVRRIDASSGFISTVAGNGTEAISGDGGLATAAGGVFRTGIALDAAGNLYIATSNHVRKVTAGTGVISTVAGGGSDPYANGVPATSVSIYIDSVYRPFAVDAAGNLYLAHYDFGVFATFLRKVSAQGGTMTTIGGSTSPGPNPFDVPATSTGFGNVSSLALDGLGNLFVAERFDGRIRRIELGSGMTRQFAGYGRSGDGLPATSTGMAAPTDVAIGPDGDAYISSFAEYRVRRVDSATGIISTVAGSGFRGFADDQYNDTGPATAANLDHPLSVAVDSQGNFAISDYRAGNETLYVTSGGQISRLNAISNVVAFHPDGSVVIPESCKVVKIVGATRVTLAGSGECGFSGDGGPATAAAFLPVDIALDAAGNLFIADGDNRRIRRVDAATGIVTTIAGNGNGYSPDGPATSVGLGAPRSIAADPAGNVYFMDNNLLRKVSGGAVTTIAGGGISGTGDGGPALAAAFVGVSGIAADARGNVYIADRFDNRVRLVMSDEGDFDQDGIPNAIEIAEGRNPIVRDNDVFANRRLFIMQQYRDFLAREGDIGGLGYWDTLLAGAYVSRGQLIESFFNSQEFQGTIAPVARLYFAYFLRVPDYAGLNFWIGYYRAGNSLTAIANFFAGSAEFTNTYGSLDNGQFVDLVYQNVLGRAPDAGGRAFWKNELDTGARTRGNVMLGFSESAEYRGLIGSEVFVTMAYSGMLRRAPDSGGFSFWVQYMDAGNSGLALIDGFLASQEYRNRFLP